MTDYKKAWEDSAKYAHTLELENAKLKQQFEAELNAAKNDYARYKRLETENKILGNTIDGQQVWVEKYKDESEEHRQHWLDARAKVSHLKAVLGVLNTNNEIASLYNSELWSIHGELQETINKAI